MVQDFDNIWKSYGRLIFSNQILQASSVRCALKHERNFFFDLAPPSGHTGGRDSQK